MSLDDKRTELQNIELVRVRRTVSHTHTDIQLHSTGKRQHLQQRAGCSAILLIIAIKQVN